MSNMSYCRFQNTTQDLADCIDAINDGDINELSKRERSAFLELIEQSKELARQFEDYNEYELKDWIEGQQEEEEEYDSRD